jgi:hypothetical protein
MIRFVNGRGQLGSALRNLQAEFESESPGHRTVHIYHTWNVWDKEEGAQKKEYDKFKKYVDDHLDERMVFVSTYCQNENYYVHYKQRSEAYLLARHPNGVVVRLPNIIGKKGIVQKLKDGTSQPFGEIEIISLERAARRVMETAVCESLNRLITVKGHAIPAHVICDLFAGTQ